MKCLVVGHLTRDIILHSGVKVERLGGGAYYSAIAATKFCDVEILTSVGKDFPEEWLEGLSRMGIGLHLLPSKVSTVYELHYLDNNRRDLRLLSRATPIDAIPEGRYDVVILNPVAGEIPPELLRRLTGRARLLAVDAQGFIREGRPGKVRLSHIDASFLKGIKVLHGDTSELGYLRNFAPSDVEVLLASSGPESGKAYLHGTPYRYHPVRIDVRESTGAGDVFLAAFTGFYQHCPFIQAVKRANAFTALFLRHRNLEFPMEDVGELAAEVRVERA